MSDENPRYENVGHPVHQSRQPVVAYDLSTDPALLDANTEGIPPIAIPGSSTTSTFNSTTNTNPSATSPPAVSSTSPSAKKTGTRSTFCPNTPRKGTKLTEDDYDHHENNQPPQPTGWLQMLGLKKSANYGEPIDSNNDAHQQSYY